MLVLSDDPDAAVDEADDSEEEEEPDDDSEVDAGVELVFAAEVLLRLSVL